MSEKVIVFDFDGVICDSTEECLITGYNAWLRYQKRDGFVTRVEEIPLGLAKYFRSWRGLVRTAGQYFVIFNSYKNSEIKSESEFEETCKRHIKEISEYEKLFFNSRERLKNRDVEYWIGLHRTYDGIPDNLKRIRSMADVFVITGKDKDSVKTFFKYIGIDFAESKIYDKNAAADKLAALEKVAQVTQKRLEDIIFLDDNINHLLTPKHKGCKAYMADWGYHLERHLEIAKDENIPIVKLENWIERLTGRS